MFDMLAIEWQRDLVAKLVKKDLSNMLCKCGIWAQIGNKPVKFCVAEHYQHSACANLLGMAVPFLCNLPSMYFDTFDCDLKDTVQRTIMNFQMQMLLIVSS